MASTNKTPNYDLPQWVASDPVEMADFNQAMADIDTNLNLVQVELSGKVSLSRYIQTTITPGQSIVVEVIGGGNAILSTSFNLQTSRSVVLALSGNATNSTQKASIHSLVSGSDIAYSVETPSNWNRITVKNNGSYPIIFQAQGIGASLVSLI